MIRWVESDEIRLKYVQMISDLFHSRYSVYGVVFDIVRDVNNMALIQNASLYDEMVKKGQKQTFSQELSAHYILFNPGDLGIIRRIFAVMGLYPVGFYNLDLNGKSLASTLFKPLNKIALKQQPFRITVSLANQSFDNECEQHNVPKNRLDLSEKFLGLLQKFEKYSALNELDVHYFIQELQENLHKPDYDMQCCEQRPFRSSMNQIRESIMIRSTSLACLNLPKVIEELKHFDLYAIDDLDGPSDRKHPLLFNKMNINLRSKHPDHQKSDSDNQNIPVFTIQLEQRGLALTAKGHQFFKSILSNLKSRLEPRTRLSLVQKRKLMNQVFKRFPDSSYSLYRKGLAYFTFSVNPEIEIIDDRYWTEEDLPRLIRSKRILLTPLIFEDIYSSYSVHASSSFDFVEEKKSFEAYLGTCIHDEMRYYVLCQEQSLQTCLAILNSKVILDMAFHESSALR